MAFRNYKPAFMSEGEMVGGGFEVSSFNDAVYQMKRLDFCWITIARNREMGKLNVVRWKLDSVEAELRYDADKMDRERSSTFITRLDALNKKIRNADFKFTLYKVKYYSGDDEHLLHQAYNHFFYTLLLEKEVLLREVQQESGKGSKYKSVDDDDMMD